jgi:hypothetical protein
MPVTGCAGPRDPAVVDVEVQRGTPLLPVRLRRLSNAEFENTASALLGVPVRLGERLPPDVRLEGYTQNAAQPVPAALGTRLAALAVELASDAVARREAELLPCAEQNRRCIEDEIHALALRAFRRPVSVSERRGLLELFDEASRDGGTSAGLTWVLAALLQSPSLWYVSEGRSSAAIRIETIVELDDYELASSLAYMVSGAPPDEGLLKLAATGELRDPQVRASQTRRLLGKDETRHNVRRFVLEWLEIDRLEGTAKSPNAYPTYDAVKVAMLQETSDFVDEVMVHEGASVRALLDSGFTSVGPVMARYYGLSAYGPRVKLAGERRGVLQHASFLSAHAHENDTSPVKRGDFVLRKVLCEPTPRPRELDIEVTIPAPDPAQTTRQRFARHAEDPNCSFCHDKIDGFGFTFEGFDAAGRQREADGATAFRLHGESLSFRNSADVSRFLADDPRTNECFMRHVFRFFSAQNEPPVEATFLDLVRALPKERRENILEALVAFVASDLFALRRVTNAQH